MSGTNGRTAVITGASRGLGLALAKRLADDGWNLILTARGEEAIRAAGEELGATVVVGDVTDEAHRSEVAQAVEAADGVDLIVNNASGLGVSPLPELLDYPLDALEELYRTNVIAPLALLQAVRPQLRDGAVIVNVTSDAAVEPYEGWGGYGSSKAALERISAGLAAENPSLYIYTVDPGDMRTQMHQDAFPGEDISDRPLPEESVPGIVRLIDEKPESGRYQAQADDDPVRETRVAITTEDFDATSALYGEGFGLEKVEEWNRPDGRGVIFASGPSTVEVLDRKQTEAVDEVETDGRGRSGPVRLAFEVSDVEGASERLVRNGAEAVWKVVQTPWGDRNRRLRSGDGQEITLFQRTEELKGDES